MLLILTNYYPVKLIKTLSERNSIFFWLAICWTLVVSFLCLATFEKLPKINIEQSDKLGHITFHYGITSLWFFFFKYQKRIKNKAAFFRAFMFSLVYGSIIEMLQATLTKTRKGDVFDVFANTAGSLLAILTIAIILKISKISRNN